MITKRGKKWQMFRRVPTRYAEVESRTFIKCSLKTDSESKAQRRADALWQDHLRGWEAALRGDHATAEYLLVKARGVAQRADIAEG